MADPLPPPTFETLVSGLGAQAMFYLGLIPHPDGNESKVDLAAARHTIDLIGVLEEKTKNNLTPDEGKHVTRVLHELRSAFVEISKEK